MDDGTAPPPLWMFVAPDWKTPIDRDSMRVDLMRCELWFRASNGSNVWHREWSLYRTPGGRWLEIEADYQSEAEFREPPKAYWISTRAAAEWFMDHPDADTPTRSSG